MNRRAFTLVELLVVIAIVALLASLSLPALSAAAAKGRSAHCQGNLRQLAVALRLYVDDAGAFPPSMVLVGGPQFRSWYQLLDDYAHQGTSKRVAPGDFIIHTGIFACPSQRFRAGELQASAGSYGYNTWGIEVPLSIPEEPIGLGGYGPTLSAMGYFPSRATRESDVVSPAGMLALGDGYMAYRSGRIVVSDGLGREVHSLQQREDDRAGAERRHRGRINTVFVDGHVEAFRISPLFLDRTDVSLQRWNADHQPHRERLRP